MTWPIAIPATMPSEIPATVRARPSRACATVSGNPLCAPITESVKLLTTLVAQCFIAQATGTRWRTEPDGERVVCLWRFDRPGLNGTSGADPARRLIVASKLPAGVCRVKRTIQEVRGFVQIAPGSRTGSWVPRLSAYAVETGPRLGIKGALERIRPHGRRGIVPPRRWRCR